MSLSFPIRVHPHTGGFVTVPSGSDAEITEGVALHVLTRTGERHLRPGFGTEALPFSDGLDRGGLQLQLAENGWSDVEVTDIANEQTQVHGQVRTVVSWNRTV